MPLNVSICVKEVWQCSTVFTYWIWSVLLREVHCIQETFMQNYDVVFHNNCSLQYNQQLPIFLLTSLSHLHYKCLYSFTFVSCLGNIYTMFCFEKYLSFKTKTAELQLQQCQRSSFYHVFLCLKFEEFSALWKSLTTNASSGYPSICLQTNKKTQTKPVKLCNAQEKNGWTHKFFLSRISSCKCWKKIYIYKGWLVFFFILTASFLCLVI